VLSHVLDTILRQSQVSGMQVPTNMRLVIVAVHQDDLVSQIVVEEQDRCNKMSGRDSWMWWCEVEIPTAHGLARRCPTSCSETGASYTRHVDTSSVNRGLHIVRISSVDS
jgi:hypothetical protein